MARREADREDIMQEARALRRRVSLSVPRAEEPVVCGVRANGYWSFYLDPDCVYQVDDKLQLRRAFVAGHLYRSQGTTLARMYRERSETETALMRTDLEVTEVSSFLEQMRSSLERLLSLLQSGEARVVETIPQDADVRGELQTALAQLLSRPVRLAPAIKTRPH
jgi:hypothetical protein